MARVIDVVFDGPPSHENGRSMKVGEWRQRITVAKHAPRIYLHPDGHTLSIGFSDTQDTLLSLNGGAEAYGDAARLAEWAEAIKRALDALESTQEDHSESPH